MGFKLTRPPRARLPLRRGAALTSATFKLLVAAKRVNVRGQSWGSSVAGAGAGAAAATAEAKGFGRATSPQSQTLFVSNRGTIAAVRRRNLTPA